LAIFMRKSGLDEKTFVAMVRPTAKDHITDDHW